MSEDNTPQPPKSNRYPYMEEFLRFGQKRLGFARNTIECYEVAIKNFYDWLRTNRGYVHPSQIVRQDIFGYRDYMENTGYAVATISARLAPVKTMLVWLIQSEVLKEENDPWPTRLHLTGQEKPPTVVPTTDEIFQMRLKPNVRLEYAWAFELVLSSGMRSNEIRQLRAGDIDLTKRPIDKELGRPSPYFAGTINMQSGRFRTKNCSPRIVYISELCASLTRELFAKHNIGPSDVHVPLVPYARQSVQSWFNFLGDGIINKGHNKAGSGMATGEQQRDAFFLDVDLNSLSISEDLAKVIKRRQDEAGDIEDYKRDGAQPARVRCRTFLGPHSIRHSWTNFTYYRNPFGERQASESLRLLLGHTGLTTLHVYLSKLNLLDNDGTWKRLWLGKPNDWSGINR